MRLLLDAHLSPVLARQLHGQGVDAVALRDWLGGNYLEASDEAILASAHQDARVLVTGDCRTIPPLLKEWAEAGRHHAGVVLVSHSSFPANHVGRLLNALVDLDRQAGDEEWTDRAIFLTARSA